MRYLLLAFVLIVGCSKPQVAGGVTEVGNGFVVITVTNADGLPAKSQPVYINKATFVALGVDPATEPSMTNEQGELILSAQAGEYALFAEQISAMALHYCHFTANDTSRVQMRLAQTASVKSTTAAIQSVAIPGAPRLFIATAGTVDLPAGNHRAMIRDDSGLFERALDILPGSTTTIIGSKSETALFTSGAYSKVRALFANDTALVIGTFGGVVVLSATEQREYTTANCALPSKQVNAVTIYGDTLFAGTDSGITIIPLNGAPQTTLQKDEWVAHFVPTPEGLWYLSMSSVGMINNGVVARRVAASDAPFSGDPITMTAVTTSGILIGASKKGLYEYRNSTWELYDESFGDLALTTPVRLLQIIGDKIYAGSVDGVFIRENGVWKKLPVTERVQCGVIHGGSVLAGTSESGVHDISSPEQSLIYRASSAVSALSVQEKKLVVGTYSSGVVIFE